MDVEKIFHMKGGNDETSYTRNSSLQKRASDKVKHITLQTIEEVYLTIMPKSLAIADLGCSSGSNSLSNIRDMVYSIEESSRVILNQPPQFHIYLNDLPTNDFNAIFQALPDFCRELKKGRIDGGPSVYIAGYPGSFYGRLFPDNCLHFIYSSHCLHWLSKVPEGVYDEQNMSINKGSVYISSRSPEEVVKAYHNQFCRDLSVFLGSRSAELVSNGRMVLILLGREAPNHVDRGNSLLWELLTRSLATLVHQGDIEEEKLDSYDVHFYAPSSEELEEVVKREGSFKMERLEMFEIEKEVISDGWSYGRMVGMAVRAIQESSIAHHFGEAIINKLFDQYAKFVDEEMGKDDIRPITFISVLTKL